MPNFKTMRIPTIILFFLSLNSFGQSVRIDTLCVSISEKFTNFQSDKIKFPIIKTGNKQIDFQINNDIKNRFTENEYIDFPTDSTLIKWANDQIIYLGFKVTYNQNGILSLNISAEGCGAYCTSWTEYYNYSTLTGKYLNIDEIIDISATFRDKVIADKNKQYEIQKKELKEMLLDKKSGLDQRSYESVLENYNNCENSFEIKNLALYKNYLQIYEPCSLPNVIKCYSPIIELKYNYTDIKKYLKIEN